MSDFDTKSKTEEVTTKVDDISSTMVSAKVLSKLFSLTERRIRDLAQEGVLVRSTTKGRYNLERSVQNYILHLKTNKNIENIKTNNELDYEEEKAIHEKVKREKSEIELKIMKGEVHLAEDVESVMSIMLANFRSKILAMPSKLAPTLVSQNDIKYIRDRIKVECVEVLEELKDYDPSVFYNEKYVEGDELDEED